VHCVIVAAILRGIRQVRHEVSEMKLRGVQRNYTAGAGVPSLR